MKTLSETIHSDHKLRENRVAMLRQESFSGSDFIANCISSFKESALGMKNYLLLLQGFRGDNKSLSKIRSTVAGAKDLSGFNFAANHNMLLPCATGFKGPYTEYALVLCDNVTPLLHEMTMRMAEFSSELSVFISNKEVKISMRDNGSTIKAMKRWREQKAAVVEPYFTSGNNQRLQLTKMFSNPQDIVDGCNAAVQAYDLAYAADPKEIESAIGVITAKIDTLIELAEGPTPIDISKEALLNLAEKSYEIGRLVELVAVRCSECETAAVHAMDIIERVQAVS